MRSIEIEPRNGSHYVIVDGKEWSRHNDLKTAEQVRDQLIKDVWVARDQVVDQWYRQYEQAARVEQMVQDCVSRSGPYMNEID